MSTENATPSANEPAAASVSDQQVIDVQADQVEGGDDQKEEGEEKPAKTAHELRIEQLERDNKRMQRGIDRKTRLLSEARAAASLTREPIGHDNRANSDDSETLSLTKAQMQEMVTAEAKRLAPTLRSQEAEVECRQGVVQSLEKTWGKKKFDEIANDLDDALGGLMDRNGMAKPATEAIFEADDAAKVIEYLTDPDNGDEADRISRMTGTQAARFIAKLEVKLAAESAKDKPKASKVPAPLEAIRGQGSVSGAPNPSDTKAWMRWANEQEAKGR